VVRSIFPWLYPYVKALVNSGSIHFRFLGAGNQRLFEYTSMLHPLSWQRPRFIMFDTRSLVGTVTLAHILMPIHVNFIFTHR
jgi:hypothetical protein